MVDTVLLFNPITLFLAALFVGLLLYAWGGVLAPKPRPYGHKQEMYTGGEAPKVQEVRPSYRFYEIALFFTLLHVAALVLVTAPGGATAWVAFLYLGILVLAVLALIWR